ncbi:MAG TPA: response regulator transcription factor, partial [Actinophytocola sp.]|nr:response regulator transcription factor [Actinophytocola sp.]
QQVLSHPDGVTERLDVVRRMLELGPAGPPDGELWARLWRIDAALQLGSMSSLDEELARLGLLADRLGWQIAHWHLHRGKACRALLLGRLDEALAENELAAEFARRTQDSTAIAICITFPAEVVRLTGRHEDLPAEFEFTDRADIPIAWSLLGSYYAELGDRDTARGWYERLRPILRDLPREGRWVAIVAYTGELATAFGDNEIAAWCYRELLACRHYFLAAGSGTVACKGSVSRFLGALAAGLGERAAAVEHLTEAVAMDDRIGALPYRTLSQVGLAEALLAEEPARAGGLARQAAITARRLGMAPTLRRADELVERARGARDSAVSLTAREREVLARLARGEANRTIAAGLVLSERTVETHVSNVLGKLGVANRAQAATWAVEHGFPTT